MKRASLEQLYSGRQVLEIPLYSVFEASRYLQMPETTLRAWVAGRTYPLRSGGSRHSEAVIELADPKSSRLSFTNLTEAHVLDALRRQYHVELPQVRRAVHYLREHFRTRHPLVHHKMLTDGQHLFVWLTFSALMGILPWIPLGAFWRFYFQPWHAVRLSWVRLDSRSRIRHAPYDRRWDTNLLLTCCLALLIF